jgi:rSAM/selenodomain-associated transferase 2
MKFSVIIPVLHEAENINPLIEHIHSLGKGIDYEIIVVDGSTTRDTISAIGDDSTISITSKGGRARQMNRGAEAAQGDVLIFLHADTRLPEKAFEKISKMFKDNIYVGGAFSLGMDTERKSLKFIAWTANVRVWVTHIPFGDNTIFLRRTYFQEIGGYKDLPLMEDVELMERIRKAGKKIIILKDKVKTSPRKWEKGGVFRTTLKNHIIRKLYYLGVSPNTLHRIYYGKDPSTARIDK